MLNEKNFPISKKWVLKVTIMPFLTTIFCLSLLTWILFLASSNDYSLLRFSIILLIIIIAISLGDGVANYFIAKKRINFFKFSFNEKGLIVEQPILKLDTISPSEISYFSLFFVKSQFYYFFAKFFYQKLIKIYRFEINYNDIRSIFIHRTLYDKLFGLSKLVITLKNVNYSKFNPPPIGSDFGFGNLCVGDLFFPGSVYQKYYGNQRIIVIPGLDKNNAQKLITKLSGLAKDLKFVDDFPRQISSSSVIRLFLILMLIYLIYLLVRTVIDFY